MAKVNNHANSHSEEDEVSEEEVHSSWKKTSDSDSDAEIEDDDEKDNDNEYEPSKETIEPKKVSIRTKHQNGDVVSSNNKHQPSKVGGKTKATKRRKGQDSDGDSSSVLETKPKVAKKKKIENGGEDSDDEYQPSVGETEPNRVPLRKVQNDEDDSESEDSDDCWFRKKPVKQGPAAGGRSRGKKHTPFNKPLKLSPALADVVGKDVMPSHDVVKKLWAIINERNLKDPTNRQYIICDDQLMKVFGVRRFKGFVMTKYLKEHFLRDPE